MELRAAAEQDYPAIVRLLSNKSDLFRVYPKGQHPFTTDQLRALAQCREALTVVAHQGEIIGFANLYNVIPDASAFIGNVIVAPQARGQGVGRLLVSYMAQQAICRFQVREIRISVFNDNTAAILLYSSLGFVPHGVEVRHNPEGQTMALIHMRQCVTESPNQTP
ncbi:MAG: GNAT family N-acetyltransferase [Marinobacter sp.]|nr:GNAT family N-acetyltransferase [Marinobacter sp.]